MLRRGVARAGVVSLLAVATRGSCSCRTRASSSSRATGHTGYLYGKLGPTGELAGGLRTLSTGETAERADRVPLTADRSGDTFVAGLRARLGRPALSEPLEGRLDEIGQRREVVAALEHRGDARRQG